MRDLRKHKMDPLVVLEVVLLFRNGVEGVAVLSWWRRLIVIAECHENERDREGERERRF